MAGDHPHFQLVAYHDHGHIIGLENLLQVFRVAGVGEAFRVHGPLVDGAGDQHVYLAVLEVPHGGFQALDGSFGAVRRALSGFCVGVVRQAVHQVDFLLFGFCGGTYHVDVHGAYIVHRLAVKAHQLGGAVDNRGERIQDPFVREGFDNNFVSDAVAVALGDAND